MRIIQFINSLATGGAETLVVDLANEMVANGHDVLILTIGPAQGVPYNRAIQAGIRVVNLGNSPYDPRSILRARKYLKHADVAHVHLFPALYFAAMSFGRCPLIFTEHSTWNRRRESMLFRLADRWAYQRYAAVTAISGGVESALSNYFSELRLHTTINVVANGISEKYFTLVKERNLNKHLRFIAVGNLDERKNFSDAIRAIQATRSTTLTIVGAGPQYDLLHSLIKSLHLEDRVKLHGESDDVAALLNEHDALLSTSRFEGFSLVAAEAMAMGLPVIGPDIDGFRDSVINGSSGILFEQSKGVAGISDAIESLRASPEIFKAISVSAARNALRFKISTIAVEYLSIYDRSSA